MQMWTLRRLVKAAGCDTESRPNHRTLNILLREKPAKDPIRSTIRALGPQVAPLGATCLHLCSNDLNTLSVL